MPDLKEVTPAMTWKLNSLYDWSQKHDTEMIAVVAGDSSTVEQWIDLSMPEYEIYTAEDTSIKEVARGNPAILFVRDGTVEWKRTLRSLDVDDFMAPGTDSDPMSYAPDTRGMLQRALWIYLVTMLLLAALSRIQEVIRGGKAPHVKSSSPDKSAQ